MENLEPVYRSWAATESVQHFLDIGRPDLAEREARRALTQEPEEVSMYVQLAQALHHQKRSAEADDALQEALRRDPECTFALGFKAVLAMDSGRHSEAEALLLQALRFDPADSHLYFNYALLMYRTEHFDKAEQLLRRSLELDPEFPRAHSLLGAVLAAKQKGEEGLAHGELGLHLEPGDESAHALLGHTYLLTGRPFKARYHLREAVRLDPGDPDLVEAYHQADKATRWTYLPMYYWSLLLERVPGQQWSIWIGAVVLLQILRRTPGMQGVAIVLGIFYFSFALYTWIAEPLTRGWLRIRPPE